MCFQGLLVAKEMDSIIECVFRGAWKEGVSPFGVYLQCSSDAFTMKCFLFIVLGLHQPHCLFKLWTISIPPEEKIAICWQQKYPFLRLENLSENLVGR